VEKPARKNRLSLGSRKEGEDGSGIRASAVVAVALAVALLVWLLLIKGDDSGSEPEGSAPAAGAIEVVSESDLLATLKGVGFPVYWAGPRSGVEYEVSRPEEGRAYVRYLPEGEEAGTDEPFLTVGSYQQPDALASIRKLAQKPGAILMQIPAGGIAYAEAPGATSAYMAFPGLDIQIEVFDPRAGKALELIRSGAIVPVS
jgi:hypothetical protein